jgi:hypothetical protein
MANNIKLSTNLVLNKYVLSLFGENDLQDLSQYLKDARLEDYDENNQSRFLNEILNRYDLDEGFVRKLERYDHNIFLHTKDINKIRYKKISWKYFQYLGLLFTEIVLDQYFADPESLVNTLNEFAQKLYKQNLMGYQINPYTVTDFNKLVFWQATGSGKTLILHVNLKQINHYLHEYSLEDKFNKFILLTPNEGLSNQHLSELKESGIPARIFNKDSFNTLFSGKEELVEIIDIHKLKNKAGEKTVAVDSFGSNNIVFVDEGHRGSSGDHWFAMRDMLTTQGFSFEYSATFEQAITFRDKNLFNLYSKTILFDYSYKHFYLDGYGKDYQILNIQNNNWSETRFRYLTASVLSFYQQQEIYEKNRSLLQNFNIAKPLMIFVGGSVNAVRQENKEKVSDVVDILLFLKDFIENKNTSVKAIDSLLKGESGLINSDGSDIFKSKLDFLRGSKVSAEDIYQDILLKLFNNTNSEARFQLVNLKSADGEIGIRLGANAPYFAVINVGDDRNLLRLCEENNFLTDEQEFSDSLFENINHKESNINLLIGSKKFTEGWNSWRVSCIGLMNLGRTEGSEIIQLFGRGVRLKGYNWSLKRSSELKPSEIDSDIPEYLYHLETLNIFGIRADYMNDFKEYLEAEGIPAQDNLIEITLPTINNFGSLNHLKVITSKAPKFDSQIIIDTAEKTKHIDLNLYSKLTSITSVEKSLNRDTQSSVKLNEKLLSFIDWDSVLFELEEYRLHQGWNNVAVTKQAMIEFVNNYSWYSITAPANLVSIKSYADIEILQEEVVLPLLKKYLQSLYRKYLSDHEKNHRVYTELTEDDPNFIKEYVITIDKSEQKLISDIRKYSNEIKKLTHDYDEEGNKLKLLTFSRHLYQPLIYSDPNSQLIKVSPVALNDGEKDFIEKLRVFYRDNKEKLKNKEIYLLRNQSKGAGISFFEANNFYPDFILWIIDQKKQDIVFIDPKGIRQIAGISDLKIQLCKSIKEVEEEIGEKNISLHSFILSTTYRDSQWWGNDYSDEDFYNNNVLFMESDPISKLFNKLL